MSGIERDREYEYKKGKESYRVERKREHERVNKTDIESVREFESAGHSSRRKRRIFP